MTVIANYMAADHRHCDDRYVAAENAVSRGDWAEAAQTWETFKKSLEHHFSLEESLFFPGFEAATGMTMGPTAMMRQEHVQMRGLLSEIDEAVAAQESERYLGLSETLMMMMQQHNMKEEQILYPMMDQRLDGEQLLTRVESGAWDE